MPETLARPSDCSNFKLRQLARRVSHYYDAELAKAGLKTTQYSLLSRVARRGPIRPVDLAPAMAIDASTLTRNLKPLLAAGWLLIAAGADGRSHTVAITEAGRDKRNEGSAIGWRPRKVWMRCSDASGCARCTNSSTPRWPASPQPNRRPPMGEAGAAAALESAHAAIAAGSHRAHAGAAWARPMCSSWSRRPRPGPDRDLFRRQARHRRARRHGAGISGGVC